MTTLEKLRNELCDKIVNETGIVSDASQELRDKIRARQGFDACIKALSEGVGEFDEHSAVIEGEERQDTLSKWDEPDVFAEGARWQHSQDAARIGLAEQDRDSWKSSFSIQQDAANKHIEQLEAENARLRGALEALKIGGECWCDLAISDPRMSAHSSACKLAREALK